MTLHAPKCWMDFEGLNHNQTNFWPSKQFLSIFIHIFKQYSCMYIPLNQQSSTLELSQLKLYSKNLVQCLTWSNFTRLEVWLWYSASKSRSPLRVKLWLLIKSFSTSLHKVNTKPRKLCHLVPWFLFLHSKKSLSAGILKPQQKDSKSFRLNFCLLLLDHRVHSEWILR